MPVVETPDARYLVHDLGNLIQIATSAIRIIARHPDVHASQVLDPLVAHAATSLERAGALVRQSIAPRREAGTEYLRLDTCIAEMRPLLQYACGPAITVRIAAELRLAIECRRLDFENALLNLALNARDAMPTGGILQIATEIAEGPEMPEAIVMIADSGGGMTDEVASRALDQSFTTKAEGLGTGTGLPSVKAFVDEIGGRLSIDSLPGKGTTVTLRMPVAGGEFR